jgi:Fis family transcriptional regulator, factor for inversion stimulation protein
MSIFMNNVIETPSITQQKSLREFVLNTLESYFSHLDAALPPTNLYDLVMEEIEPPLFIATLKYTKGNQCKAAILLGISRSTLRKKLKLYNIDQT